MSVVKGKVIFCEGKESGLDHRLLNKVIDGLPETPTIKPVGSKFGFSAFTQGYFSGKKVENSKYLVFRDRDFDHIPTPDAQLLSLKNKRGKSLAFLTHRACIENYLIDAKLIHKYWIEMYREKQENPSSKWGHKDSPGVKAISEWIEIGAQSIKDYQTVRWAISDLLRMPEAREQLKTTWTKGSGTLPGSLKLNDCQSEAVKLIDQFRESVEKVTPDHFEKSLAEYQKQFGQEEFWGQKQYLIWFHGKDVQKAMQEQDHSYISLKNFYSWAIDRIDITQHPDIMELRTQIERL